MKIIVALLSLALLQAQDTSQSDRVMKGVRAALAPALPYPETDELGAQPANNDTEAFWMVRPLQPGDTTIEVLANPFNQVNQLAATRAMAKIQSNIESAQRKAENQYQAALEALRRTGKSQDVDGISLADEGIDGEKIDADSHVTIEIFFNQPDYHFAIAGRIEPGPMLPSATPHLDVAAHTYKQDPKEGPEHYKECEKIVFLGPISAPQVAQRGRGLPVFDVVAKSASTGTMVVRLHGNQQLVTEIAAKTNWTQLLELLK